MPTAIVIMGVGGTGKTTVGTLLSHRLGVPHVDADSFHSAANIAKMRSGHPLDDEDRRPWLARIAEHLRRTIADGDGVVVGCSALKRRYRDVVRVDPAVRFLHLVGSLEVVRARLETRSGHFFRADLLASQFADLEPLEPDEPGVVLDIGPPPAQIAEAAVVALTDRPTKTAQRDTGRTDQRCTRKAHGCPTSGSSAWA